MTYFATGAALTSALSALPTGVVGSYKAFDAFYYAAQYMGSYSGTLSPIEHFVQVGAARGYKPNADFDPVYYQTKYPDLAGLDSADLLFHYVKFGLNEGRPGNAALGSVNWANYLTAYPDVAAYVNANLASFGGSATNGAIAHYVKFGANQGFVAPGVVTGSTFTLTTGADNFTGTSANDTFTAYVDAAGTTDTFTGADTIDGGQGTDTLNITTDGNAAGALPGATIKSIENYSIREVGGTAGVYDFSAVAGEASVTNDVSTDQVTFSNLASGTAVTVKGNATTTNGATVITMASATNAVNVTFDAGYTGAANFTVNSTGAKAVTINSTGANNTVGTIDVDTAALTTGVTINATTGLVASLAADYAAATTLTISGAATNWAATTGAPNRAVDLSGAALSTNITKVDASGLTAGGAGVVLGANTTSFIGGAGNDFVGVDALVFNGTATVAAGAGSSDVIRLTDAAALATTTATRLTGFEVLELSDDNDGAVDAFDLSLLSGITNLVLNADSAGDGFSVSKISAAQAANVQITATQNVAPVLAVTDATSVGQLDTVGIAISDNLTAKNTITLADLTLAGVETINIAAADNITFTAATGLTAMTSLKFTGAGNVSFTTGALATNVNATVDASASTGTVTVNASGATGNGILIKGSATKANTLTGTNQNDVIVGGTGIDTLTNTNNAATDADTMDFVSDSAADIFTISSVVGKTTIANFDAATKVAGTTAGTAEDLVNVAEDTVDGAEVVVTAAGAQGAVADDTTYVIEQAVGAAGSLTTASTTTLVTADFTAATLTNVAAFLSERFTDATGDGDDAVFVLNNGTNTYIYALNSSDSTTAIAATEISLIGVLTGALLSNEDVYQTV